VYNKVHECHYGFGLVCVEMEPDNRDVMPDMAGRIEARALVTA